MHSVKDKPFHFKQFSIAQDHCSMKIGTDGVLLGAWADVHKVDSILDIGAGSGVIAIMLAQRSPHSQIHAVEIEAEAYHQASENMKNSPWPDRLTAFHTSIQEFSRNGNLTYDLIVSNPPFFTGGTFSSSQEKNSVRHTVKLPHGDLLNAVRKLLSEKGRFCTILPVMEGLRFKEMAATYGLYCSMLTQVLPAIGKPVERLLMKFEKNVNPFEKNELVIQKKAGGSWTDDYKTLTQDFYLKL